MIIAVSNKRNLMRNRLMSIQLGFADSSDGKQSTGKAGNLGSIPGLGISTGEGNVYPL